MLMLIELCVDVDVDVDDDDDPAAGLRGCSSWRSTTIRRSADALTSH